VYKDSRLTLIEANEESPLRGGQPNTNNMIERGNRTDKEYNDYNKVAPLELLQRSKSMINDYSTTDLSFIGNMKKPVNSEKFLKHVVLTLQAHDHGTPTCLEPKLQFTNCFGLLASVCQEEYGLSPGTMLVPTYRKLLSIAQDARLTIATCPVPTFVSSCKKELKHYKLLVIDSERHMSKYESHERFKVCTQLFRSFRCIRPLTAKQNFAAVSSLYAMLQSNGYQLLPWDDVVMLTEERSFVTCDCEKYLKYAWCYHVCAFAYMRGIVLGLPERLDPTTLFPRKYGSTAAATRGKALSYDD